VPQANRLNQKLLLNIQIIFNVKFMITDRIHCASGVSLSVQASTFHYCTPRTNNGPWTHVEVGFIYDENEEPIDPPDSWKEYATDTFPCDVYAYVPLELVVEFVRTNGGFLNSTNNQITEISL
jgi:hypothetical protein